MTRATLIYSPAQAKVTPAATDSRHSFDHRSVREEVPVIIMNLFYTGLGIARDLAGHAMRVVGLSAHPKIFGNFTRYCEVRPAPNSQQQPEQFKEFLLDAAGNLDGAVIFPTRDFDVLLLDRYRDQLEAYYRLAIPPHNSLVRVLNKYFLVEAARQAGVTVPHTLALNSQDQLARVPAEIGFPCVLKPISSYHWRENNNWERVGGRKAFLVTSPQELSREYERVREAHPEILIQEWIPGDTENIAVLGAYVGNDSQPLAWFTARKLVQSPDDFGTGCIVRSEEIPELFEPTLQLWRILGYRGMAEVEYKRDPRTGKFVLIEMNTRHWDQHNLGRASGINLSLTAYHDLIGHEVVPTHGGTKRATWIAEDALLFYSIRNMYRRKFRFHKLWLQLARPRIYGIFSWNDPWPFARYMFTVAFPAVVKQAFRKLKGKRGNHEAYFGRVNF